MIRNRMQHTTKGLKLKKVSLFIKKNYFLLIFVGCIGFVGVVAFYKLFISKPTYIYAKVKVGQGLWWASTQKPNLWFVKAIQKAGEVKDLTGKSAATVLDVSYYPYTYSASSGQYDVYVTLKLKVSSLGRKETYIFNRETIGVSSPIDLEFPTIQFSGTIVALDVRPFAEKYVEKTIALIKRVPFSWEYNQIQIGDTQTDGKRTIFTIIGKSWGEPVDTSILQQGTLINTAIDSFIVQARILVKVVDDKYVFGEEYIIAPGKVLQGVAPSNFTFTDYYITKVE